jgi:uncharacterized phage protein (TIGR02218 family)
VLILPPAALLHLSRESKRLAICGAVYRNDGLVLRATQFDDDLEIAANDLEGLYLSNIPITASDVKSSSDLSVDNMEIDGKLDDALAFAGFTARDIEAGLFDDAPFETFLCQWDDPNAWQIIVRRGYLGKISRTHEGKFKAEWRGILQPLQQTIGRVHSETCDVVRFGDSRCGKDVESLAVDVTVTGVTSRRRFDTTAPAAPSDGYYDLGEARWITGENASPVGKLTRQIKRGAASGTLGQIELWDSTPFPVRVGDTVRLRPGCDRRFSTCQFFGQYKRFRGDGFWCPGVPTLMRAPGGGS